MSQVLALCPLSSPVKLRVTPRLSEAKSRRGTWVYQLTVNKTVVKPQLRVLGTRAGSRRCQGNISCSFDMAVSPSIYSMSLPTMVYMIYHYHFIFLKNNLLLMLRISLKGIIMISDDSRFLIWLSLVGPLNSNVIFPHTIKIKQFKIITREGQTSINMNGLRRGSGLRWLLIRPRARRNKMKYIPVKHATGLKREKNALKKSKFLLQSVTI